MLGSSMSSSSNTYPAERKHGICRGTLWMQVEPKKSSSNSSSGGMMASFFWSSSGSASTDGGTTKTTTSTSSTTTSSSSSASTTASTTTTAATCDFCVLQSTRLETYENIACYRKGDAPTLVLFVVGASALSAASAAGGSMLVGAANLSSSSSSPLSSSTSTSTTTTTISSSSAAAAAAASFRLVTDQGTHVLCQAPNAPSRDLWLSALQAGLEQSLTLAAATASTTSARKILQTPQPQTSLKRVRVQKYCRSCGAVENAATSSTSSASTDPKGTTTYTTSTTASSTKRTKKTIQTAVAPLYQYGQETRMDLCGDCLTGQGLLMHTEWIRTSLTVAAQERQALERAYQLCLQATSTNSATASDKRSSASTQDESYSNVAGVQSSNSGSREGSPTSGSDEAASRGTTTTTNTWIHLPPTEASTRALWKVLQDPHHAEWGPLARTCPLLEKWVDHVLNGRIGMTDFMDRLREAVTHEREQRRAALKQQAFLLAGDMGSAMKLLLEHALPGRSSSSSCSGALTGTTGTSPSHYKKKRTDHVSHMSAMDEGSSSSKHGGGDSLTGEMGAGDYMDDDDESFLDIDDPVGGGGTWMLSYILEFFLDLCRSPDKENDESKDKGGISPASVDGGELSSVAFFWPQLCQLHLRMLPPEDAADLARVELVEDFLLTVACQHSIHLALHLVWSHIADLEESLQQSLFHASSSTAAASSSSSSAVPCMDSCRRRRFCVLRFLCELESLLFDFEGGWGGGSVSLGKMLAPTGHQVELLKASMKQIQQLRFQYHEQQRQQEQNDRGGSSGAPRRSRCAPRLLDRSVRIQRLRQQQQQQMTTTAAISTTTSKKQHQAEERHQEQVAVREKLRIARNADYFSSHLNFTKRICDIAEKLRFMEVENRPSALERELQLLNGSGALGGDPLNTCREDRHAALVRVVRVPTTEGHVFRSKERTPVLMLMEVVDEAAAEEEEAAAAAAAAEKRLNDKGENASTEQQDDQDENAKHSVATSAETLPTKGQDEPLSPKPTKPTLEGALDQARPSRSPGALRRFESGGDSATSGSGDSGGKSMNQKVVSDVVVQQLDLVLPELDEKRKEEQDEGQVRAAVAAAAAVVATGRDVEKAGSKDEGSRDTIPSNLTRRISGEYTRGTTKKLSALGTFTRVGSDSRVASNALAPTGDERREVLNAIMMTGVQGNTIAAGAALSVQRILQDLERKRATELLLKDDVSAPGDSAPAREQSLDIMSDSTRQKLESLGLTPLALDEEPERAKASEEDEILEAIRLLLIQNRVAQGQLSPTDAAKVLQHTSLSRAKPPNAFEPTGKLDDSEVATVDAGDIDPRLVGCGPVPPAVLQALTLWKSKLVTNAELLELVKKDIEFVRHSVLVDAASVDKLNEDSAFWGRFAFGERWAEKKARIGSSSPEGSTKGWDLVGVIVKSNDDLRQEAFVMQLIELCKEAFEMAGLELWVNPYRILATGRKTGIIEMVRNAMSFDALKKRPGYGKGGLREHLQRMTEFTADPGGAFKTAQSNFVRSLAAYSLMSYFFLIKDRHNGNLLLDTAGHVIHIDFGFVFGIAPGGSFSLEMSTPFKLTEEMLDVMGGLRSPLFSEFVTLFCCGFLALQAHCNTFLTIVEITSKESTFKCFENRDTDEIVSKLRERFCPDLSKEETVAVALDLIKQATTSYGTRQYDMFQYLSQGIAS